MLRDLVSQVGFPKIQVGFSGPHYKGYNILGFVLRFSYLGKLQFGCFGVNS